MIPAQYKCRFWLRDFRLIDYSKKILQLGLLTKISPFSAPSPAIVSVLPFVALVAQALTLAHAPYDFIIYPVFLASY
jgi:hypothetical protein